MASPASLAESLPPPGVRLAPDELLSRFLDAVARRGLTLYPAQEEAILELFSGKHVILGTPTGSGKSLVAEALHFKGLCEGKTSFYTCPIKALVNEKFFALCEAFGPDKVGMMTGDASVNRGAKVMCCTAEILANLCLSEEGGRVDYVVMDEFHYYADRERGVAWQLPLLSLPQATFLLMSATLGPTDHIEGPLTKLTGRPCASVRGLDRPVPLEYEYRESVLHETIADLVEKGRAPIYLVNFTQRAAAEYAQALTSVVLCSREEREAIRQRLFDVKFDTPYGKDVERFLKHGVGLHHAGLMPKYRRLTERLAQAGLLKVVSGTDSLGMGVNIPLRTVLFTQLCKFDGQKVGILTGRDFHQIAGRAGRKGFDERGFVVAQAPEHVIENVRLAAKGKPRRPPPQKGYVPWDRSTFEKLVAKPPEPLASRFEVTHGMLVNLLQADDVWPRGGYARLVQLIARAHVWEGGRRRHRLHAAQAFRALVRAGIVEVVRRPSGRGSLARVHGDLQRDFSLNHTLSLYLVEAVRALDPAAETYALDVLSLVEAVLEDPDVVLWRQLDKLKEAKLAELKSQGVPYEDRIAELEKLEPPRPNAAFIHGTFAAFAERHPWVRGEDIRPKSVARDMFERLASFNDYVVEYDLKRSEGVLMRYLTDVMKTLSQSVPEAARDEALDDILLHLRRMIRAVDSSLLDEWERMRSGEGVAPAAPASAPGPAPLDALALLAANPRALTARVRSELHGLLALLARRDWAGALGCLVRLEGEIEWTAPALEQAMAPYFAQHAAVDLRPRARLPHNTLVTPLGPRRWEAIQKIVDPEGEADWMLDCIVDLAPGRDPAVPLIALRRIGV